MTFLAGLTRYGPPDQGNLRFRVSTGDLLGICWVMAGYIYMDIYIYISAIGVMEKKMETPII